MKAYLENTQAEVSYSIFQVCQDVATDVLGNDCPNLKSHHELHEISGKDDIFLLLAGTWSKGNTY